jgi:hypothetical protein
VYPRVADSWMANFDSQLQSCFRQPGQPEVLGLGDVLPLGGLQDLHHGAVRAVQEEPHETRQESFVSLDSSGKLPKEVKLNVLARDCGPTLSERVLLHNDAALLGLDFVNELAVESPQVGAYVPVVVDLDHHEHVPEPSALAGGLSGEFRKLFDIKQKPIFALSSTLDSSSEFIATSASLVSARAVPSTTLMSRVTSAPSSSSLASPTTSPRASVLEQPSVPAFSRDGILGKAGESLSMRQLGKKSSVLVQDFVFNSVVPGTLKIYRYTWDLFRSYGKMSGVDVDKYNFDFLFICQFFLYRLQSTSSLSSILSSRSAISFMWKIHSSLPCPTESNYVSLFIKGISRKFKQIPNKAYPISYDELQKIFSFIVGDSELESLPFVDLRFIAFLLTSYSSFGRYEEISNLKIEDIYHEDEGFVLTFKKGKSYQYGESHIGVLSNLPRLVQSS